MKKTLILSIALLFVAGAAARAQSPARDRLDEIEQMTVPETLRKIKHRSEGFQRFELMPLSNITFGMHSMKGTGFKRGLGPSWQIQWNMLQARFAPTSWLGLEAGWDLSWDTFRTLDSYNLLKDNSNGGRVVLSGPDPMLTKLSCRYKLFSFAFPLQVHFRIGPVGIRSGVELGVPLRGRLRNIYFEGDNLASADHVEVIKVKRLQHGSFYYAFTAEVTYDGLGIYVKHCPQAFIPGLGFNYWSFGIRLGLD